MLFFVFCTATLGRNTTTGTTCGPIVLADLNKANPAAANADYCKAAPTECATNRQAVAAMNAAIRKYKTTGRGEIVATVAWMLFESGQWKYSTNHFPGVPGQGTRCMMSWDYVLLYARSLYPSKVDSLTSSGTISDGVKKQVIGLVLNDRDSFGAGFWFLATQYLSKGKQLRDGSMEDFKAYMLNGVNTSWTAEREKWWKAANSALVIT